MGVSPSTISRFAKKWRATGRRRRCRRGGGSSTDGHDGLKIARLIPGVRPAVRWVTERSVKSGTSLLQRGHARALARDVPMLCSAGERV
ncbi:hypothetical protein [Corynebacterium sp. CCM 9203]|uniref:hypothetical protein n=1 Tax=Corynebacterium sp. CCM 9203 TaxID=3057615 RepID=UPI003523AF47